VAGQGQRQGQLLDGEGAGDPDLGQGGDDVGVDVEVAEQRRGLLDRRAAELLDALLELLGRGRAALGVLDLGGGRRGVLDGGQCSRLGLEGDAARSCASRVGCRGTRSSADVGLQTGSPGTARETASLLEAAR
jgi:hypothetical protein